MNATNFKEHGPRFGYLYAMLAFSCIMHHFINESAAEVIETASYATASWLYFHSTPSGGQMSHRANSEIEDLAKWPKKPAESNEYRE